MSHPFEQPDTIGPSVMLLKVLEYREDLLRTELPRLQTLILAEASIIRDRIQVDAGREMETGEPMSVDAKTGILADIHVMCVKLKDRGAEFAAAYHSN